MISLTVAVSICLSILGITFGLVKIIYDVIMRKVDSLDLKQQEHSLAIQTLKNFNDIKVDRIEKDITDLRSEIKALTQTISDKIHRDSNIINQQKSLIERMSRILDDKEKLHIG